MNTKTYNSNTLGELLEKAKKLTEELTSASLGSPLYISCEELVESIEIYSAESFDGEEEVEVEAKEDLAKELDLLENSSQENGESIPIRWGDKAYLVTSPADLNLELWSYFEDSKGVTYTRKKTDHDELVWTLSLSKSNSSLGGELEKVLSNSELFELMMERFYKYGETYRSTRFLVKSSSPSS